MKESAERVTEMMNYWWIIKLLAKCCIINFFHQTEIEKKTACVYRISYDFVICLRGSCKWGGPGQNIQILRGISGHCSQRGKNKLR